MDRMYADEAVAQTARLLAIDSPTGYTAAAAAWVRDAFSALGFAAKMTAKGGVLVDLGGPGEENAALLLAHADTLGGMVAQIKANGRLRIDRLGGLRPDNCETENVRVYTRGGRVVEGTMQLCNPSVHVNTEFSNTRRTFETTEIVLDEDVRSAEDARALGIENGDIVAFDPRTRILENGYIKSRFLDDKLLIGVLYSFAKYLRESGAALRRRVWAHITVFEEVNMGGCASVPAGVTDVVGLDMGCVGDGLRCTEKMVSICAKDTSGPYHYGLVSELIEAAKRENADWAVDIYPNYGSDAEAAVRAGNDVRHGLIGPGVYASHGYERSHVEGVWNTLRLLKGFLTV